ncbi:hypothetical protein M0654_16485 [Rhizobium sp. NTR19]|uniref:DUF945 domain-containing protein n=1 Tax=Neorhizobium turbinariae TaxID=2937795 RepID=A0ABT0IUN8_9HYPH|nr:hypothetical protein [Neorhizobium turbinariae]MCK8781578.1 hypothetical protein [Neorhizobium turbinariae]
MLYLTKAKLLLAGAALTALAGPALALDGNDLVAKLNGALAIKGSSGFTAGSINVSGSDVIAADAKIVTDDAKQNIPLGTVKFEGVEEDGGGYTVGKVLFDNVNVTQDKSSITASDISITNLSIPADPNGNDLRSVLLYDEATVGRIVGTVEGKQAFSVDRTTVTTELADDNSSVDFDVKVAGVKADLGLVDEPQAKDTIQQLGLTSLDGSMMIEGSWSVGDGTLDLTEYALDFKDVGRLSMSFSLTGYTLDFIKSLNETTQAMAENPSNEQAQQAAGLAMLGLMQRLTFNSAEIRFEDAGITKRGIDYAAKKQNTDATQLTQMLKGMTPFMLAQFNVPELQNMVTEAVNTYLDKPGSFTISAEPENAVPFPMIVGAAMGAPNTLPKVLGVTVTAND